MTLTVSIAHAHATNQNEHLQQLEKVFDKIREKGLKLNLKKCEFGKASINYMGHISSSEGLFPEREKVDSILNMKPPSYTSELRVFFGFFYLLRYIYCKFRNYY